MSDDLSIRAVAGMHEGVRGAHWGTLGHTRLTIPKDTVRWTWMLYSERQLSYFLAPLITWLQILHEEVSGRRLLQCVSSRKTVYMASLD
jgi:hypothetical protein